MNKEKLIKFLNYLEKCELFIDDLSEEGAENLALNFIHSLLHGELNENEENQIIWMEPNLPLKDNEEFDGLMMWRDGNKIGVLAKIKVWDTASLYSTKLISLKLCE